MAVFCFRSNIQRNALDFKDLLQSYVKINKDKERIHFIIISSHNYVKLLMFYSFIDSTI